MKLNCGLSYAEKCELWEDWHPFFALWPRRVGSGDCRWLETIERKGQYIDVWGHSFWIWEYRARP